MGRGWLPCLVDMHLLLSQVAMFPPLDLDSIPIPIGKLGDAQGLAASYGDMFGAIGGVNTARGQAITTASPPSWATVAVSTAAVDHEGGKAVVIAWPCAVLTPPIAPSMSPQLMARP